jgi:hypothetical protein
MWSPVREPPIVRGDAGKGEGRSQAGRFADLVSLVRFVLQQQVLTPFAHSAQERYERWLQAKEVSGGVFTSEQRAWLGLIRDHIATSLSIEREGFGYAPFSGMRSRSFRVRNDSAECLILGYLDGPELTSALSERTPRPQDDAARIGIARGHSLRIKITPLMPVDPRTAGRSDPCERSTDCRCSFEKGIRRLIFNFSLRPDWN